MTREPSRLLLIDSYDSFTYNLAALCRQSIPNCCIHIIKNDEFTLSELLPYLQSFSAIIVGPGPGSPENLQDIGIVKDLWKISDADLIPIFGVCLGLQSLAIEFGARLKKLSVVKHGQVSRICHDGRDIFKGVGDVHAVRYHSLHVELVKGGEIEQLAWADDGVENGLVVMAVKHTSRPFWAVQYHPESVCTQGGGQDVVRTFWHLTNNWASNTGRTPHPWSLKASKFFGPPWPYVHLRSPPTSPRSDIPTVDTAVIDVPEITITIICELLGVMQESSPFVLLDSAAHPGRFSIIGSLMPTSVQIKYYTGDSFVTLTRENTCVREHLGSHDIWSWLSSFMRSKQAQGGSADIPFWGGLIGCLSYELGVHSLSVSPRQSRVGWEPMGRHPDVNLVYVERSLVLDNVTRKIYLQSIIPDDGKWLADTILLLKSGASTTHVNGSSRPVLTKKRRPVVAASRITIPDKHLYKSRISLAKEHLFDGDSYELCLTAHTRVTIPTSLPKNPSSSSWERYKTLRANNPAPHSAYFRLHPTTLLSSSPERFLSFSRPPSTTCHLRPIKGTVRKSPEVTRGIAEELLAGSTKEVAENLMIVDLIRHDLHRVFGEDVRVTQFCSVEEYETVWQLVSVIEGRLSPDNAPLDYENLGWEVLRKSLPPGSMTGAPKKRSVEILQTLEDSDRSIYSGVFGYWCVGGSGDWSVTIRSCFKFDDHYEIKAEEFDPVEAQGAGQVNTNAEQWVIGAGGAITALSDPEAEWDEMLVKLQSVLRAFGVELGS